MAEYYDQFYIKRVFHKDKLNISVTTLYETVNVTKSLSEKSCCSKCNPCTCKMKHSKVILNFLFPPYDEFSESVYPRMCPSYNPSSCPKTWSLYSYVFLSVAFEMDSITIFFGQFSNIRKIISFIHTHILNNIIYQDQ